MERLFTVYVISVMHAIMSSSKNIQDINIPVKRNTGETLKERMNENAYNNLLPARYMGKRPDDSPEDQEDVFPRVARNISVAELYFKLQENGVDIEITPEHIKDAHSKPYKLAEEVFGEGTELDDDVSKVIEEDDLPHLSYEKLIEHEGIPEDVYDFAEGMREDYEELMSHLNFMPNTPTIMNAGQELQMLSACFVISPDDDMRNIHQTLSDASMVMQAGGGMGYGFWKLRPYGDPVGNDEGISSGPMSFMKEFDVMCEQISQGRTRRGAQMGVMKISHPDVLHFIHAKNKDVSLAEALLLNDPDDMTHNSFGEALEEARELIDDEGRVPEHLRNAAEGHLSNFNISVGVTDDFMDALKNDEDFTFTNPRTEEAHIVTEETKEMAEWFGLGEYLEVGEEMTMPAEVVWERMVDGAYENGEPGVVYLERMNKRHSFDVDEHPEYAINATNPCGEQALSEYEACNLGHINLSTLVSDDPEYQDYRRFVDSYAESDAYDLEEVVSAFLDQSLDWDELDRRIELGTRFLENVITMSDFPVEKITDAVRSMRKIGLGIMGLAQLYVQLGLEYGSEPANEAARQIMQHINHESKRVSNQLAEERGVFSDWEDSKYANPTDYPEWFTRMTGEDPEDHENGYNMRNHSTTTIAPTGSTSMLGNTTGGCEPMFNVAYYKNVTGDVQGDEMLVEFDDYFLRVLEANNVDVEAAKKEAEDLMQANEFTGADDLETVPDEIGELFVTSGELSGREHASVQCALQKGVDSSISKTINFPNEVDRDEMGDVFEYIYDNGGKGVTAYRDGTRSKQVLTTRKDNKEFSEEADADAVLDAVEENISDEWFRQELAELLMETAEEDLTPAEFAEELGMGVVGSGEEVIPKPRERGKVLYGRTEKIETGYGNIYVTVNEDEEGLVEVFAQIGKSGGFMNSFTESVSRLISVGLRSGIPPEDIIDHLEDIRSPKIAWDDGDKIQSIPDAISTAMDRYLESESRIQALRSQGIDPEDNERGRNSTSDGEDADLLENIMDDTEENDAVSLDGRPDETEDDSDTKGIIESGESPECPDCGAFELYYSEGCKTCESCGWSEC